MKKEIKRYTPGEDQVIIENIKIHPNNLAYSFEKSASILRGRDIKSIEKRYYNVIRKKNDNLFAVGSSKGLVMNVKNSTRPTNAPDTPQLIIKLFEKLSEEDKLRVLERVF